MEHDIQSAMTNPESAQKYKQNLQNYLIKIDDVITKGKYKADWGSLMNHKVPDWYQNAKFGIFIHWGLYSVAGVSDWYARFMYMPHNEKYGKRISQSHIDNYGKPDEFGYRDFVPLFKAENYNPAQWADLFKDAGAKFVMPVAEHHDGFQLYDSELSDWCASKKGPMRDCIGELKAELEARDMVFTTSSHRVEHYWFMGEGRKINSDIKGEFPYSDIYWPSYENPYETQAEYDYVENIDQLFIDDFLARTCEIVDKYRPKILYFDAWIQAACFKTALKKIAAYYYNRAEEWGEEVTINYKFDAYMQSVGTPDIERGQMAEISPIYWQNDTSIAKNSWGYSKNNDYKTANDIICDFVDVVSKNGSFLLNVGPRADGTIPAEDEAILRTIGAWLKLNSEGIYGSTHWKTFGEGPTEIKAGHFTDTARKAFTSDDFRFTFKDGTLYTFAMKWPENGTVKIKSLGRYVRTYCASIKNVQVFGANSTEYKHENDCLTVTADIQNEVGPVCIRIELD